MNLLSGTRIAAPLLNHCLREYTVSDATMSVFSGYSYSIPGP